MTKWIIGIIAAFAVQLGVLMAMAAFTGFADVPCQDVSGMRSGTLALQR
jgi:hypothetical protein